VRAIVPWRYRHAVRVRVGAIAELLALPQRVERLETMMLESHERLHERSRRRWTSAAPDVGLTFGRPMSGEAFVAKAQENGAFGSGKVVLEIGPGYGRLLEAAIERGVPFDRWIGVDISANNVEHLRRRFGEDGRVAFVHSDAETVALDGPVDTIVSSLTLKHLFPSFEAALTHVSGAAESGATIVVDLIEGERRYFQDDATTYIRWYTRDEVAEIFARCGCEVTRFDYVQHDADHRRLMVIGRRVPDR
jgi:SAM-dependent methyltransferase